MPPHVLERIQYPPRQQWQPPPPRKQTKKTRPRKRALPTFSGDYPPRSSARPASTRTARTTTTATVTSTTTTNRGLMATAAMTRRRRSAERARPRWFSGGGGSAGARRSARGPWLRRDLRSFESSSSLTRCGGGVGGERGACFKLLSARVSLCRSSQPREQKP